MHKCKCFSSTANLGPRTLDLQRAQGSSLPRSRGEGHSDTPCHRTGLRLMGSPTKHPLPRFHSGPKAAAPACQHLRLQSLAPPLGLLGCHTLSPHLSAEQRVFTLQMCRGLSPLVTGKYGARTPEQYLLPADHTHSEGVTLATQPLPTLRAMKGHRYWGFPYLTSSLCTLPVSHLTTVLIDHLAPQALSN